MATLEEAANAFLAQKRVAVAGASRKGDTAGNVIYKKLRKSGYEVFPVNPKAQEIEGDKCYPDLAAIPEGVDGVVIATPPEAAAELVEACGQLGIKWVWMHRAVGKGSVDEAAVKRGEELGLCVIPGSCPMMFCEPVDIVHRCGRWFTGVMGKQPTPVNCG